VRPVHAAIAIPALACAACSSQPGPSAIAFGKADYDRAFEAALEAARADGLEPVVADRALGVIETDARTAGSLLEPWRTDNAGLADGVAHTVNFERRRARFEFVPEAFASPVPQEGARSEGPALPGSERAEGRFDLTKWDGTIELRTWVFVDRAFRPNQQIGRWTLGQTRYATDPGDAPEPEDESTRAPTEWTPVGRDVPYEERLAERVRQLLREAAPTAGTPATAAADPAR
jgi:hypothetical protein